MDTKGLEEQSQLVFLYVYCYCYGQSCQECRGVKVRGVKKHTCVYFIFAVMELNETKRILVLVQNVIGIRKKSHICLITIAKY